MQRSLPPQNLDWPTSDPTVPYNYHVYQVVKPLDVSAGPVSPWFEQPGQGTQYRLPSSIQTLLDSGYLVEIRVHDLVGKYWGKHGD